MAGGEQNGRGGGAVVAEVGEACEQLIEACCGYRFGYVQQRNLHDAIRRRIGDTGCGDGAEYVRLLQSSPEPAGELGKLLSEFTNTETHFFRHIGRFELLRDQVLPSTTDRLRGRSDPIRILSAGCSSGEEVYSLIISMLEAPELWSGRSFEVVGCDINQRALQQAARAAYGKWSLRFTPPDILERHFVCVDAETHQYRVAQSVREHATFKQVNLASDELFSDPEMAGFDVVFCCNVIIYLTEDFVTRVIDNLHQMLVPEGFLFMGYTEGLHARRADFEPLWSDDYVAYQRLRPVAAGPTTSKAPAGRSGPARKAVPRPILPVLANPAAPVQRLPSRPVVDLASEPEPAPAEQLEEQYLSALGHCRADRQDAGYQEVITLLEAQPFHCRGRLLKGYLLGSRGELEAATAECTKALDIDPVFAQAYLLRGMLLEQKGDWDNAIGEVKKALYLDPDLPLAHFVMGKLRRSAGDRRSARGEFASTIQVLRDRPDIAIASDIPVEFDHQVLQHLAETYLSKLDREG